jgi:hypothetical protein
MRQFDSGATRDSDDTKPDYEGYLSPLVLKRYGEYMTRHRVQADGGLRASDNWQRGMPLAAYMKSLWRHFMDLWTLHRAGSPLTPKGEEDLQEAACAIMFNTMGYLHEHLKAKQHADYGRELVAAGQDRLAGKGIYMGHIRSQ